MLVYDLWSTRWPFVEPDHKGKRSRRSPNPHETISFECPCATSIFGLMAVVALRKRAVLATALMRHV